MARNPKIDLLRILHKNQLPIVSISTRFNSYICIRNWVFMVEKCSTILVYIVGNHGLLSIGLWNPNLQLGYMGFSSES